MLWIAWGLSYTQKWLLWTMNTPSHVIHILPVHSINIMQNELTAACWFHNHMQISFTEDDHLETVVVWRQLSQTILRIFSSDSANSHAILCELLHGFHFTATIIASSVASVCTESVCPAFTHMCVAHVTIPVSYRCCSKHWNTYLDGTDQGNSMYSHVAVSAWL
jgi:hypothetical protein